ncbi:MAG: glycosyltransferase family 4 protein [Polynucleobacter sp.]
MYLVANRTRKSFLLRDLYPIIIANLKKSKIIYHIVGNDFVNFYNSLSIFERKLLTLSIRSNNFIFAVLGDGMKNAICEVLDADNINSSKLRFIDLPAFITNKAVIDSKKHFKPILHSKNITIGFMSNLITEKGYNYFLKAFTKFSGIFPGCNCWIAGSRINGGDYQILDELLESGRINYYPYLMGDQKWKLLAETDVFILPTFYETEYLPLSIIDAMLCGCYVISCNTGDIAKYISKYNGALVPHRSAEGISEALISYINMSPKADRINIRNYVINIFSENNYRKKLLQIWREN